MKKKENEHKMQDTMSLLKSALSKMGFGDSLGESLSAFKFALQIEPIETAEAVKSFDLPPDEDRVVGYLIKEYLAKRGLSEA